jgi:hypothetical protein
MDEVYNIKYVDAYYSYEKELGETKLSLHEAYGYVKRNKNNIVITFIKRKYSNGKEEPALGLVIPNTAIISKEDVVNYKILNDFKVGVSAAVTWLDIVIFDSGDIRNDCPIMYTEGNLSKIEKDHIVLEDPETIQTHTNPVRNHPVKKPSYYIIPTSLISDIKIINKK